MQTERAARNVTAPAAADVVRARDESILAALKVRPWPETGLVTCLPPEPNQTADQRIAACKSALIRLRVKGLIEQREGLWRMAAA